MLKLNLLFSLIYHVYADDIALLPYVYPFIFLIYHFLKNKVFCFYVFIIKITSNDKILSRNNIFVKLNGIK